MKNQALFSSKDKSNILKCHLLQFTFGALRVKSKKETENLTIGILPTNTNYGFITCENTAFCVHSLR